MKIKEMIEALQKLDPELEVYLEMNEIHQVYTPVTFVKKQPFVTNSNLQTIPVDQYDVDSGELHLEKNDILFYAVQLW